MRAAPDSGRTTEYSNSSWSSQWLRPYHCAASARPPRSCTSTSALPRCLACCDSASSSLVGLVSSLADLAVIFCSSSTMRMTSRLEPQNPENKRKGSEPFRQNEATLARARGPDEIWLKQQLIAWAAVVPTGVARPRLQNKTWSLWWAWARFGRIGRRVPTWHLSTAGAGPSSMYRYSRSSRSVCVRGPKVVCELITHHTRSA